MVALAIANGENAYRRVVESKCPGCGVFVTFDHPRRGSASLRWQLMGGGRYLGILEYGGRPVKTLHECGFGGGGDAGDRAPRPSDPPPRVLAVEREQPGSV
jgi:hypothetical protein